MALNKKIVGGIIFAFILATAYMYPRLQGVNEGAIRSLPENITVGDIASKFGAFQLGQGIYIWYPHETDCPSSYKLEHSTV